MLLKEWLLYTGKTVKHFATEIDVSRSQVHKYLNEKAIPEHKVIIRIFKATGGAVTPNDFHGLKLVTAEVKDQKKVNVVWELRK